MVFWKEKYLPLVSAIILFPSSPSVFLSSFNSQHESMKKQHAQDVALTKATVRKLELQVESLNRALEEKVRLLYVHSS